MYKDLINRLKENPKKEHSYFYLRTAYFGAAEGYYLFIILFNVSLQLSLYGISINQSGRDQETYQRALFLVVCPEVFGFIFQLEYNLVELLNIRNVDSQFTKALLWEICF